MSKLNVDQKTIKDLLNDNKDDFYHALAQVGKDLTRWHDRKRAFRCYGLHALHHGFWCGDSALQPYYGLRFLVASQQRYGSKSLFRIKRFPRVCYLSTTSYNQRLSAQSRKTNYSYVFDYCCSIGNSSFVRINSKANWLFYTFRLLEISWCEFMLSKFSSANITWGIQW